MLYFKNVRALVDHGAQTYQNRIALVEGETEYSFLRLKDDVYAMAAYLSARTAPGAHIAVRGINSYAWIRAYLAIMSCGRVVVPLPAGLSDDQTRLITKMADTELILSDSPIEGAEVIDLNADVPAYDGSALQEAEPHDIAKIIFTSGTTGVMKGVPLTHENILVIAGCEMLEHAGTISIAVLPFSHAFESVTHLLTILSAGVKMHICPSIRQFPRMVAETGCDVLFTVPSIAEALLTRFRRFLDKADRLKSVVCGGAPITESLARQFASLGIRLHSGYGLSECSPLVSLNHDAIPGCCGRPLSFNSVRISAEGEIQVRGKNVFSGYYKNEAATREVFTEDGWLKTGDLGRLDEEGQLYLTGRVKNLIILSNGENVSPEEIESLIINRVPGAKDALCFEKNDTLCVRIYAPEAEEEAIRQGISRLNAELPPYQRVSDPEIVRDPLPVNATGKKIR